MNDLSADTGGAVMSFAVIADTHLEADPAAIANVRCARVLAAIRARAPAFVLHLGDVVHPLPDAPSHAKAAERAAALFGAIACPVKYLPGNHDIGDKPLSGQPAKRVRADYLARWNERYGADSFVHDVGPLRIVGIDAPLLSDDPAVIDGLRRFLADSLDGREDRRLVLATHYPLFLHDEEEPSHYDNIVPSCRQVLVDYCRDNAVECVFSGHIHNYLFARRGPTRFHGAPACSFVRRDYSELYRSADVVEFGREDPWKVGFLWVTCSREGMAVDMIAINDIAAFEEGRLPLGLDRRTVNLGVNLRHDWAETIDLPINPPTGTFARRTLRDDYTMRMLLELNVGTVRIPLGDLLSAERRRRASDLRELGVRVHAFTDLGADSRRVLQAVDPGAVDVLELVVPQTSAAPDEVACFLAGTAPPRAIAVGFLEDYEAGSPAYQHAIDYGVLPDPARLAAVRQALPASARHGLVASFAIDALDEERIAAARAVSGEISLHILMERQSAGTARALGDEVYPIVVERALARAAAHPDVRFVFDTFCEFDRGYHARTGFVDRQLNPTAAGMVLRLRRPTTP